MSTDEKTEPRFGERLRMWLANEWLDIGAVCDAGLRDIADAIDQDAERAGTHLAGRHIEREAHLRHQVEEAVERLKRSVQQPLLRDTPEDEPWPAKDVLDVEPFLAELARIFGERAMRRSLGMAVGAMLSHLQITPVGDRVLVDGSVPLAVWRETEHLRRLDCGATREHAARAFTEFGENEPANRRGSEVEP